MPRKKKYLWNGEFEGRYVRAWKVDRSEIAVQIWNSGKPEGDPDGDWGMPALLGVDGCIKQAILQTPK